MTPKFLSLRGTLFLSFLFMALLAFGQAAHANDLKLDLQLIWGTNDEKSPDPKHKPIDGELSKKMRNSPFKWKNYFEVNRKAIAVAPNATQETTMSPQCKVAVKNLGDGRIEVNLIGKGKQVRKETHPLSSGLFLIGGDATNDTAWFVVVKEVK